MAYWLFKSEPKAFSFQDLLAEPDQTTGWDGVRNFQARNFLRDQVKVGDEVLFYHSNADPPCIVGDRRGRPGGPSRSHGIRPEIRPLRSQERP